MKNVLLVTLGGALGSVARYGASSGMLALFGPAFPYGTLTVNTVGSFLICLVMRLAGTGVVGADWRLFLTTGLMGGFTTYSSFDYETFRFVEAGAYGLALTYLVVMIVVCFAAGAAGWGVARWLGA